MNMPTTPNMRQNTINAGRFDLSLGFSGIGTL
jgi:hypothetical protein